MRNVRTLCAALALAALAWPAQAQSSRCPGATSNDDCDRIIAEATDRELGAAVDTSIKEIDGAGSTVRIERVRGLYAKAAKQWLRYRDAQCNAEAAALVGLSARTLDGLTARCHHEMTQKRIDELRAGAGRAVPAR